MISIRKSQKKVCTSLQCFDVDSNYVGSDSPKRVGIIVNTPGQVHFYRNIYKKLIEHGHNVSIIARDCGDTIALLNEFNLPYNIYAVTSASKIGKVLSLPKDIMKATAILKNNGVEIISGFGVFDAYASALLGVPSVVFCDNEPMIGTGSFKLQFKLFFPFVDCIITPSYFRGNLGRKHIRINGTKELAYLHQNIYKPNKSIFDILGISQEEHYSILRFNSLGAFHDLGVSGFSIEDKKTLVRELEKYGRVFISSEQGTPSIFEKYAIKIPKNRIHDALYFASLLVTDTQTMATEAAILGTPTVRCNSFVGTNDMGNFVELERKYHLMFNFKNSSDAISKAIELMNEKNIKTEWSRRRAYFLKEKTDVTAFMVWFIENYPKSFDEMKNNPESQYSLHFIGHSKT